MARSCSEPAKLRTTRRSGTCRSDGASEMRYPLALTLLMIAAPLAAQDLEPRAFAPAPVGFNIAAMSLSHSSGDLVFDASLPIKNVTGKTDGLLLGYQRFFGLFGQTAKFAVAAAAIDASAVGFVNNLYHERKFRGPVDPRVALSIIFHGAPAMTPAEY